MPVPSSYQEMSSEREKRFHIGWVWYEREFWVPGDWKDGRRVFLRFGSVNYYAMVVRGSCPSNP
jgi:beta-glucuronidase